MIDICGVKFDNALVIFNNILLIFYTFLLLNYSACFAWLVCYLPLFIIYYVLCHECEKCRVQNGSFCHRNKFTEVILTYFNVYVFSQIYVINLTKICHNFSRCGAQMIEGSF